MDLISRLVQLVKINTQLSSITDPNKALEMILHEAMRISDTQAAHILNVTDESVKCMRSVYLKDGIAPKWSSASAIRSARSGTIDYIRDAATELATQSTRLEEIRALVSCFLARGSGGALVLQLVGNNLGSLQGESLTLLSLLSNQARTTIERSYFERRLVDQEKLASLGQFAEQVAHDIRSPLGVLRTIISEPALLSGPQGVSLLRMAIERIQGIADDLLRDRSLAVTESRAPTLELLRGCAADIYNEKRLLLGDRLGYELDPDATGAFSMVDRVTLMRVLSNIINNAAEAIGGSGKVHIRVRTSNSLNEIIVSDNGRGIPLQVLEKLGSEPISFGKNSIESGHGLGVFHAARSIKGWGGELVIASREGVGTTVTIKLPHTDPPTNWVTSLDLGSYKTVIVVDDDPAVGEIWRLKLNTIQCLSSLEELRERFSDRVTNDGYLFLIDYEFAGSSNTGLDLIEELRISDLSVLVTGRYLDPMVVDRSKGLGVKILPKPLIQWV